MKVSESAAETVSAGAGDPARASAAGGEAESGGQRGGEQSGGGQRGEEKDGGYLVRYADPGYARLGRIVEREKHCPTKSAALRFCAILRQVGGKPIELVRVKPTKPAGPNS